MANSRLEERVIHAAEAEQSYVGPVDVLLRLGWLAPTHLHLWRQGRIDSLDHTVQAGLGKEFTAMRTLRTWATQRGLSSSETAYVARTRAGCSTTGADLLLIQDDEPHCLRCVQLDHWCSSRHATRSARVGRIGQAP